MTDISKKTNEARLIMTTTEELFMPVRLYYKINDKKSFLKALKRLKCVLFDEEDENHFIISYHKEAKKMGLSVSYQEVPQDLYPITLAEGYIVSNSELHLDIKSLRRVAGIIDLLVKRIIPSNTIEIKVIANVNKATSLDANEESDKWLNKNYGELFDHIPVTQPKLKLFQPQKENKGADERNLDQVDEKLDKLDKHLAFLKQQEIDNYPDIEKIAVNYKRAEHEDMLSMLQFKFTIKEMVAQMRYNGNEHFTSFDAIGELSKIIEEKMLAQEV
jgi:hypothetical protein